MRKARLLSHRKNEAKRQKQDFRPLIWAALSLTAYLIAFILAILLSAPGPIPFVYGGIAMLGVLATEASLRGRMWIFEPSFNEAFGHPQVAHRLTYFSIGVLLILESSIILGFFLMI